MKEVVRSITMNKILGLALGSVFLVTCGLSSSTHAMPSVVGGSHERLTLFSQHGMGSDLDIIRLVGTRDHDEDPTPDGSTQQMNSPKTKRDKSMKQGSGGKSRAGQGTDEHNTAKRNKSMKHDQQDNEGDRPNDRRQGGNIVPKP